MSKFSFPAASIPAGAAAAVRIVDPPSWSEYVQDLAENWSGTSAAFAILVPWTFLLAYVTYYLLYKRPAKQERAALGPLLTFYTLLTDGATAGFDTQLMSVFHPALLKDGNVEKGLLRAMARCLTATFGPVLRVPRETVVLKRDGMQVNCVALVDFAKKRQVTCQLSWVRRVVSVKGVAVRDNQGIETVGRVFSSDEVVDGIGMTPLASFHVTSFHIEPLGVSGRAQPLDVLRYLKVDEFVPFAERFVDSFFAQPPIAAVQLMLPALQEKHMASGAKALEASIQKVVRACGGLGSNGRVTGEVDATLTEEKVLQSAEGEAGEGRSKRQPDSGVTAIDGIAMTFHVAGVVRSMELDVRFTFVGMRCYVFKYEVRILPDDRTQVVLDHDTGTTTIVA